MKSQSLLSALIALLLLLSACKKEEEVVAPAPQVVKKKTVKEFVPNEDGKVSKEQVLSWNKANPMLNDLIITFKDSLDAKDTSRYIVNKKAYHNAQDSVCAEAGFIGKFKEYTWVKQNINNSINTPLLDSLKMK